MRYKHRFFYFKKLCVNNVTNAKSYVTDFFFNR